MESVRTWRYGSRLHTVYAVHGWRDGADALLGALPGRAATVGLTVRRGAQRGTVEMAAHVRVTESSAGQLTCTSDELEHRARASRVDLVRLDREQLPGMLATLPLGQGPGRERYVEWVRIPRQGLLSQGDVAR
ncbi:hypothetical protein HNQ79_004943 [Streptomyces candidus]|uniref:Uncharacterized protein n=1 Tax=Streptomyces candidus TaxID=67283 RepID=A0A7X0LSY1_9ACTN|nr:hypothetical protein [Streptomyces candidus]